MVVVVAGRALARRWYVTLAAVVVAVVGSYVAFTLPGVYYTRVQVAFLAPSSELYPNSLRTRSFDLVATAGVVMKLVNGSTTSLKMSDPDATLVGQGLLDDVAVRLPDNGGQWSRYYRTQALDVEVTGATAQIVRDRREAAIEDIQARLADLQADVVARSRITTEVLSVTGVIRVGGSPTRAAAMIWLLSSFAAVVVSRFLEVRRLLRGRAVGGPAVVVGSGGAGDGAGWGQGGVGVDPDGLGVPGGQ